MKIISTPIIEREVYPDTYLKIVKAANKYAFIENVEKLNFEHTDAFTIHAVYMPTVAPIGSSGDAYIIVSKAVHKADNTSTGWRILVDGNSKINFQLWTNSGNAVTPAISAGTGTMQDRPSAHRLNWITLTWAGSATKVAKIYKNGVLTHTENINLGLLTSTSPSIKNGEQAGIGCLHRTHIDQSALTPAALLNGGFQSLAAFNKELTEAEVVALCNNFSGIPEALKPNCIGHWVYCNDGGDKMLDLSPNYDYAKVQRMLNSGFDTWTTGTPDNWGVVLGTGSTLVEDLGRVKITSTETTYVIQTNKLVAGKTYTYSIKVDQLTGGTAILVNSGIVRTIAENETGIITGTFVAGGTNWSVRTTNSAGTTFIFDDAQVWESALRIVTPSHALLKNHTNTEMGLDHPHNTTAIENIYTKKTVAEPLRTWCTDTLNNTLPYNTYSLATHTDFDFTMSDEFEISLDYLLLKYLNDQGGQGLMSWMNFVPWDAWSGFYVRLTRSHLANIGYVTNFYFHLRLNGVGALVMQHVNTTTNYIHIHNVRKVRMYKAAGDNFDKLRLWLNDKEYPVSINTGAVLALSQTITTTSAIRIGGIYHGEPAQNNGYCLQDSVIHNLTYKLRGTTMFQQQGLKDVGPANRAITPKGTALSNSNPTFGHLLNDQSAVVRKSLYIGDSNTYVPVPQLDGLQADYFTFVFALTADELLPVALNELRSFFRQYNTATDHVRIDSSNQHGGLYLSFYSGSAVTAVTYRFTGLQGENPHVKNLNVLIVEFDNINRKVRASLNGVKLRRTDVANTDSAYAAGTGNFSLKRSLALTPTLYNVGNATNSMRGQHYMTGIWSRRLTARERNHVLSLSQLRLPGNFMKQGCELLLLPGYANWDAGVLKHKLNDFSGKGRHVHMENYPQTSYVTETIQNLRLRY